MINESVHNSQLIKNQNQCKHNVYSCWMQLLFFDFFRKCALKIIGHFILIRNQIYYNSLRNMCSKWGNFNLLINFLIPLLIWQDNINSINPIKMNSLHGSLFHHSTRKWFKGKKMCIHQSHSLLCIIWTSQINQLVLHNSANSWPFSHSIQKASAEC